MNVDPVILSMFCRKVARLMADLALALVLLESVPGTKIPDFVTLH